MVNITMRVVGAISLICRAASNPFITGIERSRMTKSGSSSLTFSMATAPFGASAQTFQLGFCSIQRRRARRIMELSSTIRILLGTQPTYRMPRVALGRLQAEPSRRGGGRLLTKGRGQCHFKLTVVVPQYRVYRTLAHIVIYGCANTSQKCPP